MGPAKWTYFYLYVILDIFSRYGVGWMRAYRESGELARNSSSKRLSATTSLPGLSRCMRIGERR